MSDQIRADYENLELIASKFTQQSELISEMLGALKASYEKLENGGWIGEGAQAFFNEMNDLVLPSTARLQQSLSQASQVTLEIRDIVALADEQAASPFRFI